MAQKTVFGPQLMDHTTNKLLMVAGGAFIVCLAGSLKRATLENPDADFAALANPVTPTRGALRFALPGLSPVQSAVDIYGITGDGRAVCARNVHPGVPEIWVPGNHLDQTLVLPLHWEDFPQTVETQFGISLPNGAVVLPDPYIRVVAIDATETIDVGLLAAESGDADGFIAAASVATLGTVVPSLVVTATLGALLRELSTDSGSQTVPVRRPHAIGATAQKLTATTSAGSDSVQALIGLPYRLPL